MSSKEDLEQLMDSRIPSDAELVAEAINKLTTAQEIQLGELNEQVNDVKEYLGLISTQLNAIAKNL